MTLIHYSDVHVELDRSKTYTKWVTKFKPDGLWVSIKGKMDWAEYVKKTHYIEKSLNYTHLVELHLRNHVLIIDTAEKFIDFHKKFNYKTEFASEYIKWDVVMEMYSGIIIAPYRPEFYCKSWYNPWDCASGCIWNLNAIKTFKLLTFNEYKQLEVPNAITR